MLLLYLMTTSQKHCLDENLYLKILPTTDPKTGNQNRGNPEAKMEPAATTWWTQLPREIVQVSDSKTDAKLFSEYSTI